MPRARRWPRRLLVAFLILLLAGVLIRDFVVPPLVAGRIVAALRELDPGVTVAQRDAGPARIRLETVALEQPLRIRAEAVEVTYGVASLLRGEVERIVVSGATVELTGAGERLGEDRAFAPPARLLHLRRAVLHLPLGGPEPAEVPIEASWRRRGDEGDADLTVRAVIDGERVSGALSIEARMDDRLELGRIRARLRADRLGLGAVEARNLRISVDNGELVRGDDAGGSWRGALPLAINSATLEAAAAGAARGSPGIEIDPVAGGATLKINADRITEFRMNLDEPVSFQSPALGGTAGKLEVAGRAFRHEGSLATEATITMQEITARLHAAGVGLMDAEIELPVSLGTAGGAVGAFSVGDIRRRGRSLGSAGGQLAVRDGAAEIDASAALDDVELTARGRWALAGGAEPGRLVFEASPAGPGGSSAAAAWLGFDGATAAGALTLAIEQADTGRDRAMRLELAGGRLSAPGRGFEVEGVEAAIGLARLFPPATGSGQRVTAASGRVGELPLRDAAVDFTLAGPRELLIEAATWTMGDTARFTATAARLDPAEPVLKTTLFVEALSLAYWLPLLSDGNATGEGLLAGRIPVLVRPGTDRVLSLGEGFLDARSGRGTLAVGAAARFGELLERSDPRFRTDPRMQTVRNRLVDAFTDFEYDMLHIALLPRAEGLMLQAQISGRGRIGEQPQEVASLTLNIHDVETVLRDLLALRAALDRTAIPNQEPHHG